MKKSIWVWLLIVVSVVTILAELWTFSSASQHGISMYYGDHNTLNILTLVAGIIDFVITTTFAYKLYVLKKDALLWTDIEFGWSIVNGIFSITADVIARASFFGDAIITIIIAIVWVLFRKHLRKLISV